MGADMKKKETRKQNTALAVLSPFPYSDTNKRYHTYSYALKKAYGHKLAKIPLDAGFTCPNRDGTRGYGGCAFCSSRGSGDTILHSGEDLRPQFDAGLQRARQKWPDAKGIAYFQSYSNTYAPLPVFAAGAGTGVCLGGCSGGLHCHPAGLPGRGQDPVAGRDEPDQAGVGGAGAAARRIPRWSE